MKKRLISVLQYLFFLGLGFGLIWYSSKDLSPAQMEQLTASFSRTRFVYLLPVLLSLLISHYSRALRWRLLMQPLGYAPGKANTYLTVLIGYFFNLLVPRLGEVMKCTMLARYEKIPADKLIGTIVAERAVDIVCLLAVTLLMLATQFPLLGQTTVEGLAGAFRDMDLLHVALNIVILVGIVLLVRLIVLRFGHIRIFAAVKKLGTGIWHGLGSIRKLQDRKWFFLHTFIIWAMYLISIWLGFKAFPDVEGLGINASVAILVFGSLGMIATQGGIGAYQFAVQKTLTLYGIGSVTGLAFGWVLWGAQTIIVLAAGIIALALIPFLNRSPKIN